ncbi:MAG: 6-phosphogluconolactonase, partial [Armatimonadetes bacterium]|nr:6-phosphogluconolactonase [Armatimonadota bacterium]
FFDRPEDVPRYAITMGIGTILDARKIILLATGEGKADAIAKAIEGPVTASCPASALQLHPRVTFIIDEAAASKLQRKDYYKYVHEMAEALKKQIRERLSQS